MKRSLVLLHVIAVLLLRSTAPALACRQPADEMLFWSASTVFVARVIRTEEMSAASPLADQPEPIVEVTFRLIEVLKGQPPKDSKIKVSISHPCGTMPLWAAMDYLFLLPGDHDLIMRNVGAMPLDGQFAGIFGKRLEKLRALAKGQQ